MEPLYCKTPLIQSRRMSERLGADVYLKMEFLQPSGSFKNRGIGTLCKYHKEQGAPLLVSSSGGNAGLAAAYSARILKLPIKVVVPESTPEQMRHLIQKEGAELIVHGKVWSEADALARAACKELGGAYISPYNHPEIWEGNATLVQEILDEGVVPDAVVMAVGGGGLFSGVADGLWQAGLRQCRLIACETEGAPKFRRAIEAGAPVTLDSVQSFATSLAAPRIADQAFFWTKKMHVDSVVVSESQAAQAAIAFLEQERILVETSCGAALSIGERGLIEPGLFKRIVIVVCGGKCISVKKLREIAEITGVPSEL
ncbi:pyridoxal-phosphate dependent enzyme [Estrella lausannensis]|uniref:L-serine ammonia-lyase n=1 Tax=Estrella lausannensis TaxID=483423 RepID=A0A0H5E855_9BACT|nr:pyridoxal-phosphate dependent enzyme [Estrella lausannensis]CRX39530.1 Pyridoxal-phosphate dependent enzyme [Estrella lausannensis]